MSCVRSEFLDTDDEALAEGFGCGGEAIQLGGMPRIEDAPHFAFGKAEAGGEFGLADIRRAPRRYDGEFRRAASGGGATSRSPGNGAEGTGKSAPSNT